MLVTFTAIRRGAFIGASAGFFAALAGAGPAAQQPVLSQGVYSSAQAERGQQLYSAECAVCHGDDLGGSVGPMLTGDAFLATWAGRPLADLVDKIENTMPPGQAPGALTRPQAIDLVAHVLQVGRFPRGQAELAADALSRISFPGASSRAVSSSTGAPPLEATANLAQLMRAVTFFNANVLFNVQVKNPSTHRPEQPVPFDYVLWGSTVYPGWQAIDLAALAIIESTPLFLTPGRRCENGRPVPVDRADWREYTRALIDVSREAYRASQTRQQEAVVAMVDRLNAACENCHKVYRDGGAEGTGRGAGRCQ
jgi:mono/diheme cytochrome c family protein